MCLRPVAVIWMAHKTYKPLDYSTRNHNEVFHLHVGTLAGGELIEFQRDTNNFVFLKGKQIDVSHSNVLIVFLGPPPPRFVNRQYKDKDTNMFYSQSCDRPKEWCDSLKLLNGTDYLGMLYQFVSFVKAQLEKVWQTLTFVTATLGGYWIKITTLIP